MYTKLVWPAKVLFLLAICFATYGFLKDVSGIPNQWMPNDKLMHMLVFSTLTLTYAVGFAAYRRLGYMLLAFYGALIEVLQDTMTVRTGDPLDWLADVLGIFLVAFACNRLTNLQAQLFVISPRQEPLDGVR